MKKLISLLMTIAVLLSVLQPAWAIEEAAEIDVVAASRNLIVVVPGIIGSELVEGNGAKVWVGVGGILGQIQCNEVGNPVYPLYAYNNDGNVKKCAVGKHPKSEKHGNTAQFSEVERNGTQENCGGIGSGCRLRLRPLPVLRRRQSQRVARIDPNAVVVDKNIAKNDRFDLFSRQLVRRNLIDLLFLERGEKALHPCVVEAMSGAAETLYHAAAPKLCAKGCAGVLTPAI